MKKTKKDWVKIAYKRSKTMEMVKDVKRIKELAKELYFLLCRKER